EDDGDHPQEHAVGKQGLTHRAEEGGIGVDGLSAEKNLEIAEHVGDHEADEDNAGDRHHDLLPDHGVPEGDQAVAGNHAAGRRHSVKMDRWIHMLWGLHTNLHSFFSLSLDTDCSPYSRKRLPCARWMSSSPRPLSTAAHRLVEA